MAEGEQTKGVPKWALIAGGGGVLLFIVMQLRGGGGASAPQGFSGADIAASVRDLIGANAEAVDKRLAAVQASSDETRGSILDALSSGLAAQQTALVSGLADVAAGQGQGFGAVLAALTQGLSETGAGILAAIQGMQAAQTARFNVVDTENAEQSATLAAIQTSLARGIGAYVAPAGNVVAFVNGVLWPAAPAPGDEYKRAARIDAATAYLVQFGKLPASAEQFFTWAAANGWTKGDGSSLR